MPSSSRSHAIGDGGCSTTKVHEKLTYMHENPVRAGPVRHAVDWKWSSARWYELRQSVGVPIGWVDVAE